MLGIPQGSAAAHQGQRRREVLGLLGLGTLLFLWNLYVSIRYGAPAGPDPWDGFTLEWATTSPPPPENFATQLPEVRSRRPLWDAKYPDLADWKAQH